MPLVLLTADEGFGDRAIAQGNLQWASQLAAEDVALEVRMSSARAGGAPEVPGLGRQLSQVVAGYAQGIETAGPGGSLGILVGHGSGGLTSHGTATVALVDLAPAGLCRVTVDPPARVEAGRASVRELRGAMGDSPGREPPRMSDSARAPAQRALWHISALIGRSSLSNVYLLACSIGALSGPELMRQLRSLWGGRVQVHGLEGYLASADDDGDGRIEMRVVRGGDDMDPLDGGPPIAGRAADVDVDRFERRFIHLSMFSHAAGSDSPVVWS